MCAEKTDNKSKTTTNNCWEGMDEMMKNCCSGSDRAIDCCAQLKEKYNSGTDSHADCMDMFQKMKDRFCGQEKDTESAKGQGPCCC